MDWRKQLTFTGWIGVHPTDGTPVANLLGFPDGQADAAQAVVGIAGEWGMADSLTADSTPVITPSANVTSTKVILRDRGADIPLIAGQGDEWVQAARRQGWIVMHLTTRPWSDPTLPRLAEHLESATPGTLWSGLCTVRPPAPGSL